MRRKTLSTFMKWDQNSTVRNSCPGSLWALVSKPPHPSLQPPNSDKLAPFYLECHQSLVPPPPIKKAAEMCIFFNPLTYFLLEFRKREIIQWEFDSHIFERVHGDLFRC